eukprot:1716280-Karenia_brevis.AAC.1
MYTCTDMYINAFGITKFVTRVGAGVVQGCPLSVNRPNRGSFAACADDVGGVIYNIRHLALLVPIFASAESHAGLQLKPKKCKLVVLHTPLVPSVASVVREWVSRVAPL